MIATASAGKPETIIVVSYGGFGDSLLTTPLIASLRQRFPRTAIDVYVQKNRGGILEGNPYVTRVLKALSLTIIRRITSLRFSPSDNASIPHTSPNEKGHRLEACS